MSGTVQVPFLLIAAALGFAFGWFAFRHYINQAFEVRQKDWREILNHAEHEKQVLKLKKEKLETHLIESNKLLQEKELHMSQLEEEAKAHGQQYKDMVVAYRESFEEKEGDLTQQIDTLKAKFSVREKDEVSSELKSSEELDKIQLMLEQSKQEIQSMTHAKQELMQDVDALQAQLSGVKLENQEILVEAEKQKNSNIELEENYESLKQEHAKELSVARTRLDESNNEYQALKAQYNELVEGSASLPDSEALQSQLDNVQKNEDGLKDKIAELQEKVRHLEHESREQITREKERANLVRNELEIVKSEKNQLASQLLQAEKEQSSDQPDSTTNIELLKEHQELQTRFDQAKKQNDEEKRRIMLLEKDAGETNRLLKEKEIQLIQYQTVSEKNQQSSRAEDESTIKSLQSEVEALQERLAKFDSQDQDALKHELVDLKSQLKQSVIDVEIAKTKATKSQKESDNFRQKHLATVSELERVKVSGAVSQNKILDLNKKLNPVREKELVRKNAELDKENKLLQQQLDKLAKLEDKHKVLQANLKIAENRYKLDLNAVNKELKDKAKKIKATERTELRLQKQVDALKAKKVAAKVKAAKKKPAAVKKRVKKKSVRKKAAEKVTKKVVKKKLVKKVSKKKSMKKVAKRNPVKKVTPKKAAKNRAASKAVKKVAPRKPRVMRNDDLKEISGIGPGIEKKLHQLGIKRFSDVAQLSKTEIAKIDEKLNFKGRIERDKWKSQARKLAKG